MKKLFNRLFKRKKHKIWVVVEDIPEIGEYNQLRVWADYGSNIEVQFFNMSKENREKMTDAMMNVSKKNETELKSIRREVLWCNPLTRE